MNSVSKLIIGVILSFFLIMIPVTVIGAIVEHPVDFLWEVMFEEGDTAAVSDEVMEMYSEFLRSEVGLHIQEYISEKNEGQERVYPSAYYILPMFFVVEEGDENVTFETIEGTEKMDILFELRYANEDDYAYLSALKNHDVFKKTAALSDSTLMTYINAFSGFNGTGSYIVSGDSEVGKAIAQNALSKLGSPYYWGASGPNYFDCSGLVYWTCQQSGLSIPRITADGYAHMGQPISREQLTAGDIITFDYERDGYADHIGIYIGDGKMVHASGEGATCVGNHAALGHVVKVADVLNSSYWNRVIHNYRRLY